MQRRYGARGACQPSSDIARRKAVHIGGQAQVIATTSRRRDFGGKKWWALSGRLVLPLRRQLNRHVVGATRRRPPRPGGLKGDGLAAQQVQHIYDAMLGQRQLTLGNKTAAAKSYDAERELVMSSR